ncbi:MAG: hypothetical protein NTW17_01595, partial [Candidatus Pacearchaeota archaeon]|nr:hypothetical protein [Candidatus Pacearchaeota archaeon]
MRKLFAGVLIFLLVLAVGAIVISAQTSDNVSETFSNIISGKVGEDVLGYVQDFVSKRGIDAQDVQGVQQVDFNALPKEVNIENIDNSNLAIYEINYTD